MSLTKLNECIEERLELLALKYNKDVKEVNEVYRRRLENLCIVNNYQLKKVMSKIMVRAYHGTIMQYDEMGIVVKE